MNKAVNMVPPSAFERVPKKMFRKHLHNSEHDDNLIDRLSGLSEDLLLRILCLLSLKEALRTCVLSRRWRDLCQFFSGSLNFEASKSLMSDPKKMLKERDGYVEWITRFLNLHRAGTIDELRVFCDLNIQHRRYIDRWIEIALIKKVKRLELDFEPCKPNHPRDSGNYRFGWKFSSSSGIRFLTGLCLKHVDVSGQILESFLLNCPLLETLHVSHSKMLTNLNVCGSSLTLKRLHIFCCKYIKSIEVYAPNLVSFVYGGLSRVHIDLKYVPQLCDVSYSGQWEPVRVFGGCQSIPSWVAASQLVNLWLHIPCLPYVDISPIQPKFPNLKCLTLVVGNAYFPIERTTELVKLCSLMKHMPLLHKFKLELDAVEADMPVEDIKSIIKEGQRLSLMQEKHMMLRELEILGFVGGAGDCVLVYYLSLIAPNLDSIVINRSLPRWYRDAPVDERKIQKLEEGRRFVYNVLSANRSKDAKFQLL